MQHTTEPVAELLFGEADATPISTDEATLKSWREASAQFAASPTYWLATGRPGGDPHVMPVLGVWHEGAIVVATRPGSRKGKNLEQRAACVITASTETVDLSVECVAVQVREPWGMARATDAFADKYGWRLTVRDGVAHQEDLPDAPVYGLYRLVPTTAFGFGSDGTSATRWRFPPHDTGSQPHRRPSADPSR